MIDLNSTSSGFPGRVNWYLDLATARAIAASVHRPYLGASMLGGDCERAVQYDFLGTTKVSDMGPRIQRIFDRGHWAEAYVSDLFNRAGFILSTAGHDGRQHGFSILDDQVQGHADGILFWGPTPVDSPIPFPALWECKCLGSKGFKSLVKDKCQEAYPKYFRQVQILMGEMGLAQCLFTAVNADTMELHHELIVYNASAHHSMVARAERILLAVAHVETLPRGFTAGDRQCAWCSWSRTCWAVA